MVFRSRSSLFLTHKASRCAIASRFCWSRLSSARSSTTMGLSILPPRCHRAMIMPCQHMPPSTSSDNVNALSSSSTKALARTASKAPICRSAAASSILRSASLASGPTWKWKPSSRPIGSPSTATTSLSSIVTGNSPLSCVMRRISRDARRSTNRSARAECKASDSFSSISRARWPSADRPSSQSGRSAI